MAVEYIDSIPNIFDGCIESYTYRNNDYSEKRYLFISNLNRYAYMKIYGEYILLTYDSLDSHEISSDKYYSVFRNETFRIELTTNSIVQYDYGSYNVGSIKISEGGKVLCQLVCIHGESGC